MAEDNAINQLVAGKLLSKRGAMVDLAGNGNAAVGLAAENRYELILMDCHMPEMDGYLSKPLDVERLFEVVRQHARP